MKIKKSYQVIIVTFILLALFIPVLSLATSDSVKDNAILKGLDNTATSAGLGKKTDDIKATIGEIIKIILSFLGIVAVILIIYGGFLWMTAGGDTGKVDKAKGLLKNAIIGLVIILAAYAITYFVIAELLISTGANTR